jgi:AcrR family transcriptional regulator
MTGRAKNGAATREAMLASARRRFLEESYENVGLRDIARDAGVDVALVGRYFGSKEELFKQVLRGARGELFEPGIAAAELPALLATLATEKDCSERREHLDRLLIILRSASSPRASELVRDAFRADVLDPIARVLGGPDGELRASLALAILMGTTILGTIMCVEPLSGGDQALLREKLKSLLGAALMGGA